MRAAIAWQFLTWKEGPVRKARGKGGGGGGKRGKGE